MAESNIAEHAERTSANYGHAYDHGMKNALVFAANEVHGKALHLAERGVDVEHLLDLERLFRNMADVTSDEEIAA
jgi:hypothetical protein